MTLDYILFEKPWHDKKSIKKSGIPIPNILLKSFSAYLESAEISLTFFIEKLDNKYRNNDKLW